MVLFPSAEFQIYKSQPPSSKLNFFCLFCSLLIRSLTLLVLAQNEVLHLNLLDIPFHFHFKNLICSIYAIFSLSSLFFGRVL